MSYKWERVSISQSPIEIIDGDRGKNYPHQNEFFDDDFCLFLNAGNVTKAGFNFDKSQFITKEKDRLLNKGKLRRGDIVLTTRGTVGNSALYDDNVLFDNVRINSGMVIFRINDSRIIDNEYFYYFLKSSDFLNQVFSHSSGSAQPQLPIKDLRNIKFPLPPLSTQFQISEFISAFDKKIDLNRKTNQTLEEIAHAIFKEWFIDFNYPGATGEMVDSPLGPIPKGWRVGELSELCNITMGQSPPGDSYNEDGKGVPFFQGRSDFNFRFPSKRMYTIDPKRYAAKLDTLVSVRAPVGDMNVALENCCIGRGLAAVIEKEGNSSFTYYFLNNLTTQLKTFEDNGTVFGSITKKDFERIQCVIPPRKIINLFESQLHPVDESILNNCMEEESLKVIRDNLLTKFMKYDSGVKHDQEIYRRVMPRYKIHKKH